MAVGFVAHNHCILFYVEMSFKKLCEVVSTAHEMQIYKSLYHRLFDVAYTMLS